MSNLAPHTMSKSCPTPPQASIVSFDAARERYSVMLNGGVVALKRVNLQP